MSKFATARARASVVVAAVAASTLCGGLLSASASVSTGGRSVYVAITPCRVMDTRPAPSTVGARSTPLKATETHTIAVLGTNGGCTLPLDASAVVMNVTAVNPTGTSFLTVFPADVSQPLASSLNWVAGQGATPNAVTSNVSADGKISFFNNAGTVDVVADIVGYYVDHNHDDRYYTKPEVDTKVSALEASIATKATKATGTKTLPLGVGAFSPNGIPVSSFTRDPAVGNITTVSSLCFAAGVDLPDGATVTGVVANGFDNVGTDVSFVLRADPFGSATPTNMASATSSGTPQSVTLTDATITSPVIDNDAFSYSMQVCVGAQTFFYDVRIEYTAP